MNRMVASSIMRCSIRPHFSKPSTQTRVKDFSQIFWRSSGERYALYIQHTCKNISPAEDFSRAKHLHFASVNTRLRGSVSCFREGTHHTCSVCVTSIESLEDIVSELSVEPRILPVHLPNDLFDLVCNIDPFVIGDSQICRGHSPR